MIFGKHSLNSLHSTGLNLIDLTTFNNDADLDQLVVILYSSGTTGLAKGVVHSHRTKLGLTHILVPNDVSVSFLPFFHVYGITVTFYVSICVRLQSFVNEIRDKSFFGFSIKA